MQYCALQHAEFNIVIFILYYAHRVIESGLHSKGYVFYLYFMLLLFMQFVTKPKQLIIILSFFVN